ncbi:type II toxin-antitoxin system Phd/YefM family antitoxin [Crocosphaera sp. XPORK-15E]|uniref:type II toxin-antitoxin system Phd/YefM family antitoxin n=1 Tax=Crocosphaera sp. XPORK-15E TaxID=3110247 RepID=UPI002B21D10C|nr:type II toxin-antitoxin system Phd/YefM family antitoxin [Crocosphaera sp. XPORK-15E]MEA5534737.1 type II toxin-antitoxin system Phd/YefM family antitoxin [Crocosphaera sp. XPORK-15E]
MTKISQLHQEWLKESEYKAAYEEMAVEFENIKIPSKNSPQMKMKQINIEENNPTLSDLINNVNESNQPTIITVNNNKKAVLVSVDEWNSIQETIYLLSIPGVKDDLIKGKKTDWEDCTPLEEIEW